ncbi:hypothetical protein P3S67_011381 [Capsicum chacoense]
MSVSMKRLRELSDISVPDDIIIEILHRLPSKSLARFECACKHWRKCIADPSLDYNCRSQRWSPHPYMLGFFCQARDIGPEEIHFFFSPKKSSEVIDGSLDESVNFLDKELHIIASSNGFILSAEALRYQMIYYVYNLATRQHVSVLIPQMSCMKLAAIGFHFRYALPWLDFRLSVTIESFSSHTNVWTTIYLTLEVPLEVCLYSWDKLASDGVIDGVFCWIARNSEQIILYDSVNWHFWGLDLPEEMIDCGATCTALGVSGGVLCYALCNDLKITVWCLESNIRSQDAVWVRKYAANISKALRNCLANSSIEITDMNIHPSIRTSFTYL